MLQKLKKKKKKERLNTLLTQVHVKPRAKLVEDSSDSLLTLEHVPQLIGHQTKTNKSVAKAT